MTNAAIQSAELNTPSIQPDPAQNVEHVRIQHLQYPPGEGHYHVKDEHTLFISLAPRPIHYLQAQDGKQHMGLYRKGDMSIAPADSAFFARWDGDEQCLAIRLTDQFVQHVARETLVQDGDRLTLMPTFHIRNPQIESISMMLLNELEQGASGSRLYLDSLTNILAINLLRQHATTQTKVPTYEGGLPPRQLRQVLDYIDAHLDQDIKLAGLAQLLDMSQFHFSHLFKQAMGISPHQYLLQQRVERAKQLLKHSDQLIVDIALECGFSSHSHLSRQFRQLTGMTPKAYRVS